MIVILAYLLCQDKTPYIQKATFSEQEIENVKKFCTVFWLLFISHISEPYHALSYCLYFKIILYFLQIKLHKRGYKSQNHKIFIFSVLILHSRYILIRSKISSYIEAKTLLENCISEI